MGQEIVVYNHADEKMGLGMGGLEGAERNQRETALWVPRMGSPDSVINRGKPIADARGVDMMQNDGPASGASMLYRDSVVGATYRLNATPVWRTLAQVSGRAFDQTWQEEFAIAVEALFDLIGESEACWLDASRVETFTGLMHLGVISAFITGEICAPALWLNQERRRPVYTAIQQISPQRVCNPDGRADDQFLRRGVVKDRRGRPTGYWVRKAHPGEPWTSQSSFDWEFIPAEKPWGRKQFIHIMHRRQPDQSRGVAAIVSVLKKMRMGKTASELLLQNLVVNASYAASIESELPPEIITAMMGGASADGAGAYGQALQTYLTMLGQYLDGSNNIAIDGVKIPHLFPNTKLNTRSLGAPGGAGDKFEESMQRHIAAGLGMSYEEYSRDFGGVSYSGLKGAFGSTEKHMRVEKKMIADRYANAVYALVLEELISDGMVPLPRGARRDLFYEPFGKEAFCKAAWIGAGRGQIDELKETQAAVLRIRSGLSTLEKECARLGEDYRDILTQRSRELGVITKDQYLAAGISTDSSSGASGASTQNDTGADGNSGGAAK